MSTSPYADSDYVGSSEVSLISTVKPESSMKQQLTATASLPVEVLINLFKRIEPQQWHTLALVCSSWHTAAAAATSSISVHFTSVSGANLTNTRKANSLRQWIRNNGAGMKELSIYGLWGATLALPLAELRQLQELTVGSISIAQWDGRDTSQWDGLDVAQWDGGLSPTLAASDGLSLLTSLTKLSANEYPVTGSFNMLSALTRLQQLYLLPARYAPDPKISCKGKVSAAALQQLTQLTSLSLRPCDMEHTSTGAIVSKLSKLQKLNHCGDFIRQASQLAGLPPSLTHLKAAWGGSPLLTKALAPDLAKLPALQHLELMGEVQGLDRSYISPCVVQDMTQLTHLVLAGLYEGALGPLLSVVGGLSQLRHLHLWGIDAVDMQLAQQDLHSFSSLTASSHLTHLNLLFGRDRFPNNVGDYIFPESRQLPDLKILKLGQEFDSREDYYYTILDQQVLDRIIQKCPAIETLSLSHALDESIDDLVTTQLSGLTKLATRGGVLWDSTIMQMIPRLSKLCNLTLWDTNLTDVGALEMTQLTGLTHLELANSGATEGFMEYGLLLECSKNAVVPGWQSVPVWQQLLATCRQSAKCVEVLLERAEAALEEFHQREKDSHQREKDLTQQLTATQQQLSAVQQQLLQQVQAGPPAELQHQLKRGATVAVGTQTEIHSQAIKKRT